jgi:hypothetical protein
MQIQVNTDDNVHGREDVIRTVKAELGHALKRFEGQLTRVEVHLGDENADSLVAAISGAARKMQHRLETVLGKQNHAKGAASIRDGEAG